MMEATKKKTTSYLYSARRSASRSARLVTLTGCAFAILAVLMLVTQTLVLFVTLVATMVFAAYLLVALRRQKKMMSGTGNRTRVQLPFALLFGLLVVPIIVAALYSFEQFNARSIYSMIIAFGMTLTFMYTLVNVPLTVYHKRMEERKRILH